MDAPEYVEQIDEQLRAYEFQPVNHDSTWEMSNLYSRKTDRLGPTGVHHEVVIVDRVDNNDVDAIESELEMASDVFKGLDIDNTSRLDSERVYLLIIAEEVTKPMSIRVERAAGEVLEDAFLLPVLVDLSGSSLHYDEPSTLRRVSTHGRMASDVEKYFRL
jgi:hypothetical protein